MNFKIIHKSQQMDTICGQPELSYLLLTDLVSVAQVWHLTSPHCSSAAYSWIIHASEAVPYIYFSIYSISFYLASTEKDALSACAPFYVLPFHSLTRSFCAILF